MSQLSLVHRPTVVFNPAIKEHRNAVSVFQRRGGWGQVPFKFLLEPPYQDVPSMINSKLMAFYLVSEFTPTRTRTK
jgi:hypothetical protein